MKRIPILGAVLLLAAATAAAGQEKGEAVRQAEGGALLDFQDAELGVVIGTLAEVAGLNVVFSRIPSRQVTLRTSRPATAEEARSYLESVARAHGLEMVEEGGLLRITGPDGPAPGAGEPGAATTPRRTVPGGDDLRLFVHRLKHAKADDIARTVGALFGVAGAPLSGDRDRPLSLSEQLRSQRSTVYGPPEARAGTVAQQGTGAPGGPDSFAAGLQGPVQVVPDDRSNALLIRATPADYETIRQAIDALDSRPLQVLIEVLIVEVRRGRSLGLGVGATVDPQVVNDGKTTIAGALSGASFADLALQINGLGGVRADVALTALASNSDATILSRPVILAQNNQEARILVGSERPFVQVYRALPTDEAFRDQVVQYRDVGTQLSIRPTINPDGYVSLSVLQEVSSATAETQFNAPIISTREAQTELLVRDGHTVVIGGLIDQQREDLNNGVPFLKDIPLLGLLFRSTSRRRDITELFLFITPHVLWGDADVDDATRRLREGTRYLNERLDSPIPLLGPDSVPPDTVPPPGRPGSRR